ncbi:MAG: flavodoxin family protein [Candidatus Methanoperedenaceae archaeon]|nr:MAG: flavodoxin family protein [Candidatus Methanoperedenaceae archaeon]
MQVLGISGSPVKNSNTDRLVKSVLEATGLDYEFIKLSEYDIHPCKACLCCAGDNICKQNDDWHIVENKIKECSALVIGGYPTYGTLDSRTKMLTERMYSMHHQKMLNKGKIGAAVAVGVGRGIPSVDHAADQIAAFMEMEGINVIGKLSGTGNVSCLSCGYGGSCAISGVPHLFGQGAVPSKDKYTAIEDQKDVIERANEIGHKMRERLVK